MLDRNEAELSQNTVIKQVNLYLENNFPEIDFKLNTTGVCCGLSTLYLREKSLGNADEFFSFLKELTQLGNAKPDAELALKINKFCKTIMLIQAPWILNPALPKIQGNPRIFTYNSDADPQHNIVDKGYSLEIRLGVEKLTALLKDTIPEDQMVRLSGENHTIAIYKKFNKYYVYDPNQSKGEIAFTDIERCSKYVAKSLFVDENDKYIDLELNTYVYRFDNRNVTNHSYPSKADIASRISTAHDPGYQHSLKLASRTNDLEMVQALIKLKADPFAASDGYSAFDTACYLGSNEVVEYLLKRLPANQTYKLVNDIRLTLSQGFPLSITLINYLITHEPKYFYENLESFYENAYKGGNSDLINALIYRDKNLVYKNESMLEKAYKQAAQNGHTEMLGMIKMISPTLKANQDLVSHGITLAIENNHFDTLVAQTRTPGLLGPNELMLAIQHSRQKMINWMLENKVSVTIDHVLLAIERGNYNLLKNLLAAKPCHAPDQSHYFKRLQDMLNGDVTQCKAFFSEFKDNNLAQSLYLSALKHSNLKLVTALKACNVQFDIHSSRVQDAMVAACERNDVNTLEILLKAGVNPSFTIMKSNDEGKAKKMSLLDIALASYSTPAVTLLLNYKVKLDSEKIEKIAMHAVRHGDLEIIRALSNYPKDFDEIKEDLLSRAIEFNKFKIAEKLVSEFGVIPTDKEMVASVCVEGQIKLLRAMLLSNAQLQGSFTQDEIAMMVNQFSSKNMGPALECVLTLQKPTKDELYQAWQLACAKGATASINVLMQNGLKIPQTTLYDALMTACKSHNATLVNVLLSHGAKFKKEEYTEMLYMAFNRQCDEDKMSDLDLMRIANENNFGDIYTYLESHKNYIKELKPESKAADPVRQEYIQTLIDQPPLRSRHMLFKPDATESLVNACCGGNINAVKRMLPRTNGKWKKDAVSYLMIANERGHSEVFAYLASFLKDTEKKQLMKEAIKSDLPKFVVGLLQVMKDYDLSADMKKYIEQNKTALCEIALSNLSREANSQLKEEAIKNLVDAKDKSFAVGLILDEANLANFRMER